MKLSITRFTIAAALALIAVGSAHAQTKLKWAHVYETSEPYHTAAVLAANEIAKRTNGRYTIDVFPASTLGKETDINQGLTLGTVDIIYTGQLFAGRTYGPLAIGGAPFMFRDFNHWKAYSTSPLFAELADGYRQKSGGHKVLASSSPAIPNAIAAILLDLRDRTGVPPHAYFGWTEGNPVTYLLRFLAFGEGDTAPVAREVLRQAEPDPNRRPRIHIG